jgi:threonine efflux protein
MGPEIDQLINLSLLHLLAVMSPGPDFAMVVRNSLRYSYPIAVCSVLGIASGLLVHLFLAMTGVSLLLVKYPQAMLSVRLLGASYLFYVGYRLLRKGFSRVPSAQSNQKNLFEVPATDATTSLTPFGALRMGFFTNVTNPKVIIFLTSLLSQFVGPTTTRPMKLAIVALFVVIAVGWFAALAKILTGVGARRWFSDHAQAIDRIAGAIFLVYAVGLLV